MMKPLADAPDRVCVIIARTRHKMVLVELEESAKRGARFTELRLDFISRAVDLNRLGTVKTGKWLATIRRPADGGRFPKSEAERLMNLRQCIASGLFDWVDLETDIIDSVRRYGNVKRLVSYHNFKETPADLAGIYDAMAKQDADAIKICVTPRSVSDCKRILDLQRAATKPTIAFAMGELGFPTRFLSLKFGAPWIYASFNRDRSLAPGLPTFDDLRTTYPVRSIKADTKVFGLLGDPVAQSYSPVLHNHTLGRMKENAIYLPFRVPSDQLAAALQVYGEVPVSGYSVTIPHKEAVVALTTPGDEMVTQCGAANTLVREVGGRFTASNTDAHAAVEALDLAFKQPLSAAQAEANENEPPKPLAKSFVLILGAGGAARAIAHALHALGTPLTITARTADRASKLAAEVGCKSVEWEARHRVLPCDVVINCTPVGMHPNVDESPLHASFLKPGLTVFDTVYSPENTLLVREARDRGCRVITGVEMFLRQAMRQVELFTGRSPDINKMADVLRKAMSPLTRALEDTDDDERTEMPSDTP